MMNMRENRIHIRVVWSRLFVVLLLKMDSWFVSCENISHMYCRPILLLIIHILYEAK